MAKGEGDATGQTCALAPVTNELLGVEPIGQQPHPPTATSSSTSSTASLPTKPLPALVDLAPAAPICSRLPALAPAPLASGSPLPAPLLKPEAATTKPASLAPLLAARPALSFSSASPAVRVGATASTGPLPGLVAPSSSSSSSTPTPKPLVPIAPAPAPASAAALASLASLTASLCSSVAASASSSPSAALLPPIRLPPLCAKPMRPALPSSLAAIVDASLQDGHGDGLQQAAVQLALLAELNKGTFGSDLIKKETPLSIIKPKVVKPRRRRKQRVPENLYCRSCGSTETPEWRRGPDGEKSLCNACGLHFAKILRREQMVRPSESVAATTGTSSTKSSIDFLLN